MNKLKLLINYSSLIYLLYYVNDFYLFENLIYTYSYKYI